VALNHQKINKMYIVYACFPGTGNLDREVFGPATEQECKTWVENHSEFGFTIFRILDAEVDPFI